ncbi:hypothetical protein ANOM_007200 [Aspergillus nomiae NRRL 13137]|uniref:Arrestin-like N-terminal domain-containing protein n=1 Tax=Aspergillus nomiae NRRL (strain ATCC 15546 / NRRL 13137 / CBS 260.88 / M93) TaxID=1509407 RepID=A0A0L1IVW8_ASPN3|nr:uncharacterized protein ANOM_007200 [Aspergillus nomiae NRRL 13137]KNG83637.1 hypothetical protein ANOM_007200 [Aspergillus nomiae NRRL 13137]
MDLQVRLDQEWGAYTEKDTVSGHLIFRNKAPVNISTITVKLSGIATSRLNSGRYVESHQLFQRFQNVFPPQKITEIPVSRSLTVGSGTHIFPFSLTFPATSECHKISLDESKPNQSCTGFLHRKNKTHHLLRKLPPSTGDTLSAWEVRYFLDVTITKTGILKGVEKLQTRNILFYPVHEFSPPKSILRRRCLLAISHDSVSTSSPLAFQVDVELLNGQCLLLGYPIPLRIKLTKVGDRECFVWLNDFQTMLVGSTETHASGLVEKDTQFQVIQTMSNIHHVVSHDRALNGAELCIGDSIWNKHRLPTTLTPSFETCNISQTYTLEVRLGLQCGYSKFRTTILEFSFPVYLAPPSMDPDPYEAKSAKLF